MSIFSNDQIKNITKDIIELPYTIDNPNPPDPSNNPNLPPGFQQQKDALILVKDDLLLTDQDQETLTNFWMGNIPRYFNELDLLNQETGTLYDVNNIQEAGKERGLHYPSDPIWIPLIPKILPSNNAQPFTGTSTITESDTRTAVTIHIETLKNGFSYGSFDDPVENHTTGYFEVSQVTDIDVNDLGVLSSVGGSTIIRILTKTAYVPAVPPVPGPAEPEVPEMITYEVVGGYLGSHGATPNLSLSASPISNEKRGRQQTMTPEEQAVLDILEDNLDNEVIAWKGQLDAQKAVIDSYDDTPPRKQANLDAGIDCDTSKSTIEGWELEPVIDPDGKYTNTGLAILEAEITRRDGVNTARITQLKNDQLGSIAQDGGTGEVTGTGILYDLWSQINLRCGKGTGTLVQYNSIDLGVVLFDKKITDANTQLTQYTNIFAVNEIVGDTEVGDIEFEVKAINEIAPSDTVLVMDNDSIIYTRTVQSIVGNLVTLNTGIPASLTLAGLARIVKER